MWKLNKFERRSYRLSNENGTELGRLVHRSPWNFRAEIFHGGRIHELRSLKWYTSTISALVNGLPVAQCRNKDWSGRVMEIEQPVGKVVLRIEQPSMWKSEFRLLDPEGSELAVVRSRITWTSTYPEFEVVRVGEHKPEPFHVLFAIFAITVRNWRGAAAA